MNNIFYFNLLHKKLTTGSLLSTKIIHRGNLYNCTRSYSTSRICGKKTHVGFRWRNAELNESDLGFFDALRTSSARGLLIKHQTFHQFRVFQCPTANIDAHDHNNNNNNSNNK